jgi:hypothetical protein
MDKEKPHGKTKGAKFCPEYGYQLATKEECPECSAEISLTTKFRPGGDKKLGN